MNSDLDMCGTTAASRHRADGAAFAQKNNMALFLIRCLGFPASRFIIRGALGHLGILRMGWRRSESNIENASSGADTESWTATAVTP